VVQKLSAVPATLRIPLAVRAFGGRLFPQLDVDDRHARQALHALGEDGAGWLQDARTVYGILARTRWFRAQMLRFVDRHADARLVNLGCGLSDYFQWLDNGRVQMLDADLPEVIRLRRDILPPASERQQLAELDLTADNWWAALDLPERDSKTPLFVLCEGVLMYLQPPQVAAILRCFAEQAPAGSQLAFDASCWLAAGKRQYNASVRRSGKALFHWGPRHLGELTAPHPRLVLRDTESPMSAYGRLPQRLFFRALQSAAQIPPYGLYLLGLRD